MTEKQLEQDARIALLAHYSSKSTNQTIIILTIALVFFTFLGVVPSTFPYRDYFLILAFGGSLWIVMRAIGRLLYWSEHGDAILSIAPLNVLEAEDGLGSKCELLGIENKITLGKKYTLCLSANNLERFSFAAALYMEARRTNQRDRLVRFSDFVQGVYWRYMSIGITILLVGVRLFWP